MSLPVTCVFTLQVRVARLSHDVELSWALVHSILTSHGMEQSTNHSLKLQLYFFLHQTPWKLLIPKWLSNDSWISNCIISSSPSSTSESLFCVTLRVLQMFLPLGVRRKLLLLLLRISETKTPFVSVAPGNCNVSASGREIALDIGQNGCTNWTTIEQIRSVLTAA